MSTEKPEGAEVAVVTVAGSAAVAAAAPQRDRSNDGVLSKFVVCIVELPFIVIGVTLGISFIIAMITTIAINETGDDVFASDRKGSEDLFHITSLSNDAVLLAKSTAWQPDPTVKRCYQARGGFRRLESSDAEGGGATVPDLKGAGGLLGPVAADRVDSLISQGGLGVSMGMAQHLEDLPLQSPPLSRVPHSWSREGGFVWEDELEADERRRLQRVRQVECEEPEPEPEDSGPVIEWDYSNCNVFDPVTPADPATGTGATGPGCNAVCDPLTDEECEGTQSKNKDFFVLVFEAVSGANAFYDPLEGDPYEYNPYDAGSGNFFISANIQEGKRLQDTILQSERYLSEFCHVSIDPTSDPPNKGKCDGMSSVLNFFHPRVRGDGASMLAEVQRAFPPDPVTGRPDMSNPMLALQTDLGCHLNYFFYELYEGPAGSGPMFTVLMTMLMAMEAEPTMTIPNGMTIPNPMYPAKVMVLGMLGAEGCAASNTCPDDAFSEIYKLGICLDTLGAMMGQEPKTEEECNALPGCSYIGGSCGSSAEDEAKLAESEEFADIMCLGDGTGPAKPQSWNEERAAALARFHAQDHLKPFLDFFFDRGFSPANPRLKYSRAFMQFGGPMKEYKSMDCQADIPYEDRGTCDRTPAKNMEDGADERSGKNAQNQELIEWFMNDIDNPSGQAIRNEFADKSEADEPQETTGGQVEVTYLLSLLLFDEIFALIIGDMLLAVISFVVVGFYMWFQTGSLWISMFGMIEITISLPMAYFVYTYIFQIQYFDFLCSLAIYIVMAIGADDVFIWFDAYKQSAYESPEISASLESRFIWAWHKAASAMLVTSLTTCVAFFATATSPLLSIKSFGYFTAFVIFLDYIYVITWLPAATVLYNWWFENTGFCKCTCCGAGCAPDENREAHTPVQAFGCGAMVGLPIALIFSAYFFWLGGQDPIYAKSYGIGALLFFILFIGITVRVAGTNMQAKEGRKTVEFFETTFSDFITDEKVRMGLMGLAIPIILTFGISATYIQPTEVDEQILPEDHPLQKVITLMNNEFPVSGRDEKVRDEIVFGIDGVDPFDRKGANPLLDYKRNKLEESIVDPETNYVTLNWHEPATQQFIAQTCADLDASAFIVPDRDPTCQEDPCDQIKTACVVAELGTWLSTNCSALPPTEQRDCRSALSDRPSAENDKWDRDPAQSYLSHYGMSETSLISADCFLTAETSACIPADKETANTILYDFYWTYYKDVYSQSVGFELETACQQLEDVNSETGELTEYCAPTPERGVKYIALQYAVDLKRRAFYPEAEFRAIYEQIEEFCAAHTAPNVNGGKQPVHRSTSNKWKFMRTQGIYVKYALYGILCAILLAFAVLLVATNNLITASLAVLTIGCVCTCVLGAMVFAGWQLGNMESICLTILAGFCVDYIVHLAHSYMESPDRSSREVRTRYSVGHMGVSVLSGALTSLGASLLLFFCTLKFFSTFGTFFFGTIMLAWLWANFFFIPSLATVGPAGTQADLRGGMCGEPADETPTIAETSNPIGPPATPPRPDVEEAED